MLIMVNNLISELINCILTQKNPRKTLKKYILS